MLRKADTDLTKGSGELTEDELEHVMTTAEPMIVQEPRLVHEQTEGWKYSHVLHNGLDNTMHEDLE